MEEKILYALYELHRHQILLNAKDNQGNWNFPKAYLYALSKRMCPYFHYSWHSSEFDPYKSVYNIKEELIEEIVTYLDDLWVAKKQIPTFYKLEDKYGREQRIRLILIIRYCFLNGGFDEEFYRQILAPMEHPAEASTICSDFTEDNLLLV